ncbi:unnamed protein product [Caenorhabditis sp. 36 PRJEB53466]|nr:unnamed protein product [Caenorhabditis sp. 36 PRJEB53466]
MSLNKDAPSAVTLLQAIIFLQFGASFFIVVLTTVGIAFSYPVASYYLMALLQVVVTIPGIVHIALQGNIWVAIYITFQLVTAVCEIYWLIYMIFDNQSAGRWVGLSLLTAINIVAVVIAMWFRQKVLKMPCKKNKEKKKEDPKPEMKTPSTSISEIEKSKAARSSKESSATSSKRSSEKSTNKSEEKSEERESEKSSKGNRKVRKVKKNKPSRLPIDSREVSSPAARSTKPPSKSPITTDFIEMVVDGFLLLLLTVGALGAKIALFPSTGCFSHDVMMKQASHFSVGEQLDESDNNITWIQTYLYDFGFGEMPLPDHWNRLSIAGIDERGNYLQENTGRLIWRQNVPFDFDRPFNIQGIKDFVVMLQRHQEYCTVMMDDPRYQQLRRENVSVAVLDHFLQECMGGLAHLLNASVIQFSNWPISDGYVTSLNLPASPASVPKTGTRLSSVAMSFLQRCQNVLFHVAIAVTRFVQMRTLDSLFARKNYPWIQVEMNEAQRPIFAGRSEMMFESVRPINNRIKFFGAASTMPPENYISSTGHLSSYSSTVSFSEPVILSNNASNFTAECDTCHRVHTEQLAQRRQWFFETVTDRSVIVNRQNELRGKYPTINWERVHTEKFVLVTFGSVAQVDKIHHELLSSLLSTFSRQPGLIIWQSNLSAEDIRRIHNLTVPDNVLISSWVPIKELLAHENIEFLICHGGINTVNELGMFGVPVLGVPLQGDQASNLARVVDLGAAELMTIIELNDGKLDEMMEKMRENLARYWQRSEKLAKMLAQHRQFHTGYQQFWLNWVARHGKRIESKKLVRYEYLGDLENRFWMTAFGTILLAVLVISS